jgi:hypothetical protein
LTFSRVLLLAAVILFVIAAISAVGPPLAFAPIFWVAVGLACSAASGLVP